MKFLNLSKINSSKVFTLNKHLVVSVVSEKRKVLYIKAVFAF